MHRKYLKENAFIPRRKVIYLSAAGIALIIVIAAAIYLTRTEWYTTGGSEGHLSRDTYLNGGTGTESFEKNYRIYYECVVNSGAMCIEIKDDAGNVVVEEIITETGSGYIYFEDMEPGVYHESEYALTEDTDIRFTTSVQRKLNKIQHFIMRKKRTKYLFF